MPAVESPVRPGRGRLSSSVTMLAGGGIWSFAGGKGGVGCTVVAAAVGFQLARLGHRVLLVDGDFTRPLLRSVLGGRATRNRARPLQGFLKPDEVLLDGYVEDTAFPGLSLASAEPAVSDPRPSPNWPQRFRTAVMSLPVDVVVVDAGSTPTAAALDFLNLADQAVILSQPEAPSNEGVALLLRRLVLRRLASRSAAPRLRQFAARWLEDSTLAPPASVPQVLDAVSRQEPADGAEAAARLDEIDLAILATGVKEEADRVYGSELAAVIRRSFGLRCRFAGNARLDDAIARTQRLGRFCMVDAHRSQGADDLRKVARNLLSRIDLSPVF